PALKVRLVPLLAASLRLGHLPTSWRDAIGVVLKKPKKDDYSLTKSYRLICFERCISKLFESIVARRITHLAESLKLLPPNHLGARPGRSAEDAVVCFVDEIRRQWRNGNVVLGIALDVAKAFPSVWTDVLVREMEEKGLPRSLRRWVDLFMSNWTCTLRLEGVSSEPVNWRSGLPQGSPLSPVLFLLYNSGALEACETPTSTAFGWVDDLNILAWGRNIEEAVSAAQRIVPGLEEWSATHQSLFEPLKTLITRFSPARDRSPDDPKVVLCGEELELSSALGMLGVTIDERLTFKQHMASCASKASKALYVRRLVEAVVLPRLTWCAAAWYKPGTTVSKTLKQVQKAAACIVTGGYRTTSLAALEVEANLLPLDLRLSHQVFRFALRLASIQYSPVAPWSSPPHCQLVVAASKEESVALHGREVRALDVAGGLAAYSDGSLLESRAGASAVVRFGKEGDELWGKKARALGQYQSVYAAELEGARLALDGILQSLSSSTVSSTTLFINNQSVVRLPFDPSPTAGQSDRLALRALVLALEHDHPEIRLTLQWLAGHFAVPGNEMADEEAKRAAGVGDDKVGKREGRLAGGRGGHRRGPKLFRPDQSSSSSSSADKSGWEEDEEERAARLEREVARLGRLNSSTHAGPDGLVLGGTLLPKSFSVHSTILARLRLDFNDLGSSKARMGLGTGLCECGMAVETRQHYLLECSLYDGERQQLRREIGAAKLKMDKNPQALDLLKRMLVFDPRKRIDAAQVLAHEYLAPYHDPEPVAPEPFDWLFNDTDLPVDTWKVMMYSEILDFHHIDSEETSGPVAAHTA
ncbi:hypothetical protein NBRC10512_000592, partial [Rhodotorula toruloides]